MEWIRENISWRQGHLLDDKAIQALGIGNGHESSVLAIVATHDCDIAQDPEMEPLIEIFVGVIPKRVDGNNTHAKNARTLHVEFEAEPALWGEFRATEKIYIDKTKLVKFSPRSNVSLTAKNYAIFQLWLASRYRRSAFPDEFENRLMRKTKLAEKISKAVKPHNTHIVGVFFDVDDGEEITRTDDNDAYTLDITLLHSADDFEAAEDAANTAAEQIKSQFEAALYDEKIKTWKLIELRYCEVTSESVLTYDNYKMLKRWRLDHISLGADPQQEVPAA